MVSTNLRQGVFMIKSIMTIVATALMVISFSGCSKVTQFNKLDDQAMDAYMDMFGNVLEYGDPARAMMLEWKVNEDLSNEDVVESIKALSEEYNMRVTGDMRMYTKDDAAPEEVKHARTISLCNLNIAKVFLNHSRWYGGFMPCRIMLVEYGNGDRYLITMDMKLAIHGGYTLPPEMLEMASMVRKAMEEVPARAAEGDF